MKNKKLFSLFFLLSFLIFGLIGCNNASKTTKTNKNLYNVLDIYSFSLASGTQYLDHIDDVGDNPTVIDNVNIDKLNQHVNIFESTLGKNGQIITIFAANRKHKDIDYATELSITVTDLSSGQKNIDAFINEALTNEEGELQLNSEGKKTIIQNSQREQDINTQFEGVLLYNNKEYTLLGKRKSGKELINGKEQFDYDIDVDIVSEGGNRVKISENIEFKDNIGKQTFDYKLINNDGQQINNSKIETIKQENENQIKLQFDDDPKIYTLKKENNYIVATYTVADKDVSIKIIPKTVEAKNVFEYKFENGQTKIMERS